MGLLYDQPVSLEASAPIDGPIGAPLPFGRVAHDDKPLRDRFVFGVLVNAPLLPRRTPPFVVASAAHDYGELVHLG